MSIALGALGMLAVALISAFIALRLAIHGREAVVPALTGLSVGDAMRAAGRQGLDLTVENRFYSADVPGGHVIAQDPPAGFHVRRDWPVRITESLGSQRVAVPNLVGQSERAAMISIRQLGLEPGAVVHMAAPGDPDIVIAQTPSPDEGQMATPRISLLVSDPDSADKPAYVMPSLVGLSYSAAASRAAGAGLRLVAADEAASQTEGDTAQQPPADAGDATGGTNGTPPPPPTSGTVVAQSPAAGHRVLQGDAVHVTLSHENSTP